MTRLRLRNISELSPYSRIRELHDLRELFGFDNERPLATRGRAPLNASLEGNDDNVVFIVEVPGIESADIKVKVEGRTIYVETPKGVAYTTVGQRISLDEAKASLKLGVLTVTIPKRDAKTVEITVTEE